MKIKNGIKWFDMDKEFKMIEVGLEDNGDWEYLRMGLGYDKSGKLFMVDLDDSGEKYRSVNYVKEELSLDDVLKIGKKCGVIKSYKGDCKWNVDSSIEDEDKFFKKVLEFEKFICEYYGDE